MSVRVASYLARQAATKLPRLTGKITEHFPVVVTSYEIVIADVKFLQRYHWKYVVVDEGHRLKNFNCKLLRELRTIPTANKLLLTGAGSLRGNQGLVREESSKQTLLQGPATACASQYII